MAYSDFTLTTLRKTFGIAHQRTSLFEHIPAVKVSEWLAETLGKGKQLVIDTEKARSEFIVAPILLASRDLNHGRFAIYSGKTLNIDPDKGLKGECDFILTCTPPFQELESPIMTIVEAKRQDIERGLGQCAAQMVGARLFNQSDSTGIDTIFGCVTTGEAWQFLKLEQESVYIDSERYYVNNVPQILGVIQVIIDFYVEQLDGN